MKMQCSYNFLSGYTDLIVYGSVFKSNGDLEFISQKFLEFLTNETNQQKLSKINMFPVISKNIFAESGYKEYNENLLKEVKTLNVFYENETLEKIKTLLIDHFNKKTDNKKLTGLVSFLFLFVFNCFMNKQHNDCNK